MPKPASPMTKLAPRMMRAPAARRARLCREVHENLHDRSAAKRLLHALLERLERDLPAHEGRHRHAPPGGEVERLLAVVAPVEPRAVHVEPAGDLLVGIHGPGLAVRRE